MKKFMVINVVTIKRGGLGTAGRRKSQKSGTHGGIKTYVYNMVANARLWKEQLRDMNIST